MAGFRARDALTVTLVLSALLFSTRARAEDGEGAATLEFRVAQSNLVLGDTHFSGTGSDSDNYVRSYETHGRDVGVVRPKITFYDFAIGGHAGANDGPQLYFGMVVGFGKGSADAAPADPAFAARFDASNISAFRTGFELGGGAYLGPLYAQATTFLGIAALSFPINGLTSCSLKNCSGQASGAHGYIQPRLSLQLELPLRLTLGAYVGENLVHPEEIETGLTLGVRMWESRKEGALDAREIARF